MRLTLATGLSAIALLSLVTTVQAGEGCGQDASGVAQHIFDVSDTDENGALSRAEYTAAGLERYGVSFDAFDENGDGETSLDEYLDLFERHHAPKDVI